MDLLGYGAFFLTTALIFSLVTLGLNLQWGLTGLFNVGLAEAGAVQLIGAEWRAAVSFIILMAVLFIRPIGLFGVKER